MKKLIMIGAAVAMSTGYCAEDSYWAQVYDAAITMKTGVCRAGKASAGTVKYFEAYLGKDNSPWEKGEEMSYRVQTTRKIAGVFWGCECETIAVPAWRRYSPQNGNGRFLGGYAFWDQTARRHFVLPNTVFGWGILNRINHDFKSVEGTWVLANNVNRQAMYLTGAGFGKASIAAQPCRSIISKISGNFAGFRFPGLDDLVGDCPYCGVEDCNVRPFCEACFFWTSNARLTAAYGTWSIKFNKSAANKLKTRGRITTSYTFKNAGILPGILSRMEDFVAFLDRIGLDDDDVATLMTKAEVQAAYRYGVDATLTAADVADEEVSDDEDEYLAIVGSLEGLDYAPLSEEDLELDEDDLFDEDDLTCDCSATNSAEDAEGIPQVFPSVVDLINSVVAPDDAS